MPYKNPKDRTQQVKRWRINNPERAKRHSESAVIRQTKLRNSGDVNSCTTKARENKAILVEYKGGRCSDCGGVFPLCCYDFDHLRDKLFQIGDSLLRRIEILKAEADKCDLVCANCHRVRTQKRAS